MPRTPRVDIQEITDVELVFRPQHFLGTESQVRVKMPDDLSVTNCDIKSTSGGIKELVSCSLSQGFVVLTNPFETATYAGNKELSIVFRGL